MIVFPPLGYYGRLGNQMFQYAALMGFAKRHGYDYGINYNNANVYGGFAGHKEKLQLLDCFNITCQDSGDVVFETTHNEVPYDQDITDNSNILGYFQSEKYFSHIEYDVRREFDFKDEIRNRAADILPSSVCVSLHIRRGDYLNLSHIYRILDEEYYRSALSQFEHYTPVFISDDIEWCKETFSDLQNAVFIENENEYIDLCVMTMCNAHIIANSSFSWWGAWLGGGKTIAPKNWFTENGPANWENIYCDHWELL
tara:strand:+ start:229 stop:993 length:765 start_codon:yes stop_codon:yes gene_type:complete